MEGPEGRHGIRIQVIAAEQVLPAGVSLTDQLRVEVDPRPDDRERPTMVLAPLDDAAQDAEQGESRDAQPVGPGTPCPRLVDEGLTDVEDDGRDGSAQARAPVATAAVTPSIAAARRRTISPSSSSLTTNGGPRTMASPFVPSAMPVPE